LRAARALLDNGIRNEDLIIPTLVLAANVSQIPRLEHTRDELAKAGGDSEARAELDGQLYSVSGGWVMSSGRVVDGVPLVQRVSPRIAGTKAEGGQLSCASKMQFEVRARASPVQVFLRNLFRPPNS
jgi:hypothetical protein